MNEIERTISILDYVLDTPKKRHIAGGEHKEPCRQAQ